MFNKHDFFTDNILSHDEIKQLWLSVYRTKGIGNALFWKHFQKCKHFTHQVRASVNNEIESVQKFNAHLVAAFEDHYPQDLFCLNYPPPIITAKGKLELLANPIIGIVGARNASLPGIKIAFEMSKFLALSGFTIASGLARGIDKAAHEGAMLEGNHSYPTIAVLAGGIDQIYPPEHHAIYQNISTKGVVLSEMPFGQSPIASLFPRRNHLIAALSKGLIIIEAGLGSGTMITAEQALALGKDIFVVPGSIKDPRYKGSHSLIKNGAILIDHAQDILDYYQLIPRKKLCPSFTVDTTNHDVASQEKNPTSHEILKHIPETGITLEELYLDIQYMNLDISMISETISNFEFEGEIHRAQDGKIYLS